MLAKSHRFHGYGSLRFVYQHGRTVRGPILAVRFVERPGRSSWRCAVVVSKKVSRSAVVRNRIRRRLYEIVRILSPEFDKPLDIVITVYGEQLATMPGEQLAKTISKLLMEAGLITKTSHAIIEPKES